MLSVRIITADHYMSAPVPELDVAYSDFRGSAVKQVPIIRIFGTSKNGLKTCIHIHGVFPYIYVPYDGCEKPGKLSYQLASSLDKAINIALGYSSANTQHVYKVVLVSGIPFYGFHRKKHQFLKIFFYKPSMVKQAVTLLQNGAVLNRVFQPYEAHIPFILQFFIDFNLHGMSFINLQEVRFRKTNYPECLSEIPEESFLPNDIAPAMSISHLEADALACHVLNRSVNEDGKVVNPGLSCIWEDEKKRRSAVVGTPVKTPPLHSERPPHNPTPSDIFFRSRLLHALETYSGSGDESGLSGEALSNSSITYPVEALPSSTNLDASIVTLHQSGAVRDSSVEDENHHDTIVNENVAVSLSLSQRCTSQTLNTSDCLNQDDLELFELLEGLADAHTSVVESSSMLGSQQSQPQSNKTTKVLPTVPDEDECIDTEEECHWMDKTLSAEDEMKRLLDLTMPELGNLDLSQVAITQPQPGPSGLNLQTSKTEHSQGSSSSGSDRIPQVDGADDIPRKPHRKSLGIRSVVKKQVSMEPMKAASCRLSDSVEGSSNGCDLPSESEISHNIINNVIYKSSENVEGSSNECGLPVIASPPICVLPSVAESVCIDGCHSNSSATAISGTPNQEDASVPNIGCESPAIHFINNDKKVILFSKDICEGECCKGLSNTADYNSQSRSAMCGEHNQHVVTSNSPIPGSDLSLTEDNSMLEHSFTQDIDVMNTIMPPVACCPPTAVCMTGYYEDVLDASTNEKLSNLAPDCSEEDYNNSVLRGDPSLCQNSVYEPEWLADLISEEVRKINSEGGGITGSSPLVVQCSESANTSPNSSLVRRSTRLAQKSSSCKTSSPNHLNDETCPLQLDAAVCQPVDLPADSLDVSSSWSPCSCNDITAIPDFTASAYFDIRESLGALYNSNVSSNLVDTEMRRLSGALRDGHMDVILQPGTIDTHCPSTSRRDELINILKNQGGDCQGTCSKARKKSNRACAGELDPVSDEQLHRGRKPLPGPPRFPVNRGKDMDLAAKYYKTPVFAEIKDYSVSPRDVPFEAVLAKKIHNKEMRKKRKLKLSLSYQKKNPSENSSVNVSTLKDIKKRVPSGKGVQFTSCSSIAFLTSQLPSTRVLLERLTRENIYKVLRKNKVKMPDKSFFGIRKGRRPGSIKKENEDLRVLQTTSYGCDKVKKRSVSWNGTDFKESNKKKRKPKLSLISIEKEHLATTKSRKCSLRSSKHLTSSLQEPNMQSVVENNMVETEISDKVFVPVLETSNSVSRVSVLDGVKNEDSGVETNCEGTSPHSVAYDVLPESSQRNCDVVEDDSSNALSLDTSDNLPNSYLEPVDSIYTDPDTKASCYLEGPLKHCVGEKVRLESIICIDGASAESSSSESSGNSNSNLPAVHTEKSSVHEQSQIEFPHLDKPWFSQQFQPWISLWSPSNSPPCGLQMFSPPRPDSPNFLSDVPVKSSVGPSCMASLSGTSSDVDCIDPTPPLNSALSAPPSSSGFNTHSLTRMDTCLKEREAKDENLVCHVSEHFTLDGILTTGSQDNSVSDIFSDKSSGEINNFSTIIKLGSSPSHPYSNTEKQSEEEGKNQYEEQHPYSNMEKQSEEEEKNQYEEQHPYSNMEKQSEEEEKNQFEEQHPYSNMEKQSEEEEKNQYEEKHPYSNMEKQSEEEEKNQFEEQIISHCNVSLQSNVSNCKFSSVPEVSQGSIGSEDFSDVPCGQRVKADFSALRSQGRNSRDSYVFTPVLKPPLPQEVFESLSTFDIPEVVNRDPYFSIHSDVKGKVEVGGNVLALRSHKCIHLSDFMSTIDNLMGLNRQQQLLFKQTWALSQVKDDLNELLMSHFSNRSVLITPVIKAPTVHDVCLWVKARKVLQQQNVQDKGTMETIPHMQSILPDSPSGDHTQMKYPCHEDVNSRTSSPVVRASTPNTSRNLDECASTPLQSPVFTPILGSNLLKTSSAKSRKCLGKLFITSNQKLLPTISEQVERNDLPLLPLEASSPIEQNAKELECSPKDSVSLQKLLVDSQFQKHAVSPVMRDAPDASACFIKGPAKSSPGFKLDLENLKDARLDVEHQYTTVLSVELHIRTCGNLRPDPERDPIRAVFYCIMNDVPESSAQPPLLSGVIVVNDHASSASVLHKSGVECNVGYVVNENSLLLETIALVRKWDPDILTGYEIEMLSWGYLMQRAHTLGVNMNQELSRVPQEKPHLTSEDDLEDRNGLSAPKLPGRILLDLWRLLRSELALQSYTFENVMYHVLHQRISYHPFEVLSKWWEHPSHLFRWITVEYYQLRALGVIRILDQLDLIGRTSELARLFGIQFFEVLSRGSQFRVESMMLRLAKPHNFVALSPSVQQRAHMRAPETVPLIMEPESRFYSDPVIVLDFQSLYPSIIIAYNYCFSTCIGRAEFLGKSSHFEFGCAHLNTSGDFLKSIKDSVHFSPCGVAFVPPSVRRGILPIMLEEILEARLAVKQSMKNYKENHILQRVLHARQLGLKLIANVTYGYTSANFSGRMPCIEIGDSVVSKGRETLERAIALVNSNKTWRARVVYGDTDSLFVLVPGRSREEAFRIGSEIADAVTQDNPSPVKLKLEKVYQPSILQTKKRYVGYMFENPDQKRPVYEAKGIETVRRDGCPAVAKMLEQSLKLLFDKYDVSLVKRYVCHQFSKLLSGRANIQDLIFAREYRGMANYRPGACVPALELTKKWLKTDRRAEPRIGERVPYVVINGPPGQALIYLVRHPHELLCDRSLRYNAVYYITRVIIPPLSRCFSLLGADVPSWFGEIPRQHQHTIPAVVPSGTKKTISQYFSTLECACCGFLTHGGVCMKCISKPQTLITMLMDKAHSMESSYLSITKVCQSCLGRSDPLDCISLDCPINYRRHQASQQLQMSSYYHHLVEDFLSPNN